MALSLISASSSTLLNSAMQTKPPPTVGCNSLYRHYFSVLCSASGNYKASAVESLAATRTQCAMHLCLQAKSPIEHPLAIADPIKHCRAPSEDFAAHSSSCTCSHLTRLLIHISRQPDQSTPSACVPIALLSVFCIVQTESNRLVLLQLTSTV